MKRTGLLLIVSILFFAPASAAEKPASYSELLKQADAAAEVKKNRRAFSLYMQAFKKTRSGSKAEASVRRKIIDLVRALNPKPAVPEAARRFYVRGMTIVKDAKNNRDYRDAARELSKAARAAPWWGDTYFNRAIALEAAGRFRRAIASFKLFMLAEPQAKERATVQNKIYALEVKAERKARKPKPKPRKPVQRAAAPTGKKIGTIQSVNQEWNYVVVTLTGGKQVTPKSRIYARRGDGVRIAMTVEKVQGNRVSATVAGGATQVSPGMTVYGE